MKKHIQEKLLKIVERNYEEIADDFNESRKKLLWPELFKLSEEIKDGDSILDAGCGNGRLLEVFKTKKINYLGVDNSSGLIELARENYRRENVVFLREDVLLLNSVADNNFDYIFSVAVLHHIPGDDLRAQALLEMKKKLKKDGKIILTVWNLWGKCRYRKLIFKFLFLKLIGKNKMDFGDILFDWKNKNGEGASQRYYHAFTKRELTRLTERASLKIEKISKDKHNYYLVLST